MPEHTLFVDLDGVLADFDRGVQALFSGKLPSELFAPVMWQRLATTPSFYEHLGWMPDGHELWDFAKPFSPIILTGLPLGNWAEPQKRAWCSRELGTDVEVLTCLSREKHKHAVAKIRPHTIPVLVDDRIKLKDAWVAAGGIFIHHRRSVESIESLRALGFVNT